jgi:YgiT-type zinc finger domain-containing protein
METLHPSLPEESLPCTECQAGHMRVQRVTYFTWLADELITVPDFPARVCDVCGRCEYDQRSINQLNLLLTPNAGKPAPSIPHRPRLPLTGKNQHAATE